MELPKITVDFTTVNADYIVVGNIKDIEPGYEDYVPKVGDLLKAADGSMRCNVEVVGISPVNPGEMSLALHTNTWRHQQAETL